MEKETNRIMLVLLRFGSIFTQEYQTVALIIYLNPSKV